MSDEYKTSITLVQKMRNQYDESSWDRFTETYTPYMRMIIFSMGLRHHDMEDLVQSIVLKAWKNLPDFDYKPDKGSLRSWLKTITKNTVLSFLKKKSTKEASLDEIQESSVMDHSPVTEAEIYDCMDKQWEIYISNLAWENVKEEFGETVQQIFLKLSKGESIEEIAVDLDVKENTVYQSRKRVKNRLYREIRRLNYDLG
ncbi:MAG: sigma-70 family RNA polymerase sigma factor [Lentisphaeraceae bacterium]|nr:sigma-70 family RNA polymerase sigma factor [Lentisphaeraceae bacterium]